MTCRYCKTDPCRCSVLAYRAQRLGHGTYNYHTGKWDYFDRDARNIAHALAVVCAWDAGHNTAAGY